jgi:hypothetical protein
MGGTEPVCREHRWFGMVLAAPRSIGVRRGYLGVASLCVDDLTTEPPAHCRLVSGHDLFRDRAWSDCTASNFYFQRSDMGKVFSSVVDLKK